MFSDWRIEPIEKLRDILRNWPDSIQLYLLVLSCTIGVAIVLLI